MKKPAVVVMLSTAFFILLYSAGVAQQNWDAAITRVLPQTLKKHREFVSIPNVADNHQDMMRNVAWVREPFEQQGFTVSLLESASLPVFLAERTTDKEAKTLLFYFHLDGQAVNPENWDQADPFVPVLKQMTEDGSWEEISWDHLDGEVNPEWRVFGRAAADDKAPIMMMLTALELLAQQEEPISYNVKIILDLQEEAGSHGFLSTLEKYQDRYAADYMIIMDGPAHPTNRPTLTFGCRGIASCSITTYGAKLPQHSGHYGNYVPNPVFTLSHLLASMKDEQGRVLIEDYYEGVEISPEVKELLEDVPDDEAEIQEGLLIAEADAVASGYQESLQYPSLNVRHIETSWKGPGLKTIIPEEVTAHLDVRLVTETDGAAQIEKIRKHIEKQGFLLLDHAPNDEERLKYKKIVMFEGNAGVNAFRTPMDDPFGQQLRQALERSFGQKPVSIRTMGGTVPIIPAINRLGIPAIIVPMVNMDNNQHNPNENIRIGNIADGIKTCMTILRMDL
jgi:acetylornithine deacetylase/succinyl-diaminopimelate desuccinylase-like protein